MKETNTVRITLNQIQIGMVSAENVYNSSGLLLVPLDTPITQTHLFRMKLYQIFNILIYNTDQLQSWNTNEYKSNTRDSHPLHNVTNNKAFHLFLHTYDQAIATIKPLLQALQNNDPVQDKLYEICTHVLHQMTNTNDLFEYLYHIQSKKQEDVVFIHSLNVSMLCHIFGNWIRLTEEELKELTLAGLLHDVGKLDIDCELLNKPGRLTKEEFDIVKAHPLDGFKKFQSTSLSYGIKMAILQHHEKFDGSGYPFGFCKEQIHDYAKLVTIADIYDAMTSDRTYHKRIPPFRVIDIFQKEAYTVLDPSFLSVFLENIALLYIGKTVILSNGETGKIVFINRKAPSRPLVQVGGKIYNLEFELSLEVTDVL